MQAEKIVKNALDKNPDMRLDMIAFEHNSFGLTPGSIMLVLWSGMAYICRRWQKRLLGAERAQQSTVPQSQPA